MRRPVLAPLERLSRYVVFLTLVVIVVLIISIIALFTPSEPVEASTLAPPTFNATLPLPEDFCPINASCLPDDVEFNSLIVNNHTLLHNNITFHGDVFCATPIWPSCLDISGQSCMYPLQPNCMPEYVENWNVTDTIYINNAVCSAPLSPSCIGPLVCTEPISDACMPDTVENWNVTDTIYINNAVCSSPLSSDCVGTDLVLNSLTVNQLIVNNVTTVFIDEQQVNNTIQTGSLVCQDGGYVDAGCIDISGETCTSPISDSCMPDTVVNWTVTDTLTINTAVCLAPFPDSCLPDRIKTINGIDSDGSLDFTLIGGNNVDITQDSPNSLTISSSLPADASFDNINCTNPIADSCLPASVLQTINNVESDGGSNINIIGGENVDVIPDINSIIINVNIPDDITVNNLNVTNSMTCSNPIGDECLPPRIKTVNGIDSDGSLDFTVTGGTNVNVVADTNGIIIDATVPPVLSLTNLNITDELLCTGGGTISEDCLPNYIKTINGQTPTAPPSSDFTIIGGDNVNIVNGVNSITISSSSMINGDLSNGTCTSGPIDAGCIPGDLILNTLTVDQFFVNNMTTVFINMQDVEMFMSNNTIQKGPFTCEEGGFVDPGCIDISGETCSEPISETCLPSKISTINGIFSDSVVHDFSLIAGNGTYITPGVNQITIGTDISGLSCTSVLDDSCMPLRVGSINGILPDAGTDFGIVGADGVTVVSGVNQITIGLPSKISTINGLLSDNSLHDFTILGGNSISVSPTGPNELTIDADISNSTCSDPISESCLPSKISTINGILSDSVTHDFSLIAGPGTYLTPGVNQLTIGTNISGLACTSPLDDSCFPLHVGTINGIAPNSGTTDFSVSGGSLITVTSVTEGILISADISMTSCSFPINANCVQIDGETCMPGAPVDDSCMQPRVKTINGVNPSGSLDFMVMAGTGITVDTIANGIKINAVGGVAGSDPETVGCQYDDFLSWITDDSIIHDIYHTSAGSWIVERKGYGKVEQTTVGIDPTNRALGVIKMFFDNSKKRSSDDIISVSYATNQILFGYARLTFKIRTFVNELPTYSNDYTYYAGFLDKFENDVEPTDGAYFLINRTIDATHWVLVTRNNNVQSSLVTTVPISNTMFQRLLIDVNESGTLVTGYIDGVSIGSISTNIPTGMDRFKGMGMKLRHIDGTASVYIDYVQWCSYYSTPR